MTIAVFLDRDGTLNEDAGTLTDVSGLKLIPGAARAVARLNDADILAIVASNQSAVARGQTTEADVQAVNNRLSALLRNEANAWLDATYYCPHHPEGTVPEYTEDCHCRKPKTGLMDIACQRFPDIDLKRSYVIGDTANDINFAVAAGCKGILVRTGYGEQTLTGSHQELKHRPHLVCRDIGEAVDRILVDISASATR